MLRTRTLPDLDHDQSAGARASGFAAATLAGSLSARRAQFDAARLHAFKPTQQGKGPWLHRVQSAMDAPTSRHYA